MITICLIDDDDIYVKYLQKKLSTLGYKVDSFIDIKGLEENTKMYDMFIIDLSIGDNSGFEIISYIRTSKHSHSKVLIASGYQSEDKKYRALQLGADFFIVKPFTSEELTNVIQDLLKI